MCILDIEYCEKIIYKLQIVNESKSQLSIFAVKSRVEIVIW